MVQRTETFTEALKLFLIHARKYKKGSKAQINKRYRICGATGHFSKYAGTKNHHPLFHWVEVVPKQYRDIDMKMAIKDYMQPYVYIPIVAREVKGAGYVNVLVQEVKIEYGNVSHHTDTEHYKRLAMKLQGVFENV